MADGEQQEMIEKGMAAVKAAAPTAEADSSRPSFHFRPPAHWMNDPNGTIYHDGWYHMFYQFHPFGEQWNDMHWGHARSRDMVNWEHLPIALAPVKSQGEDHVFSGSTALDDSGRPMIFYTSIGPRHPEQWAATPLDDDLIGWTRVPENPVVSFQTQAPYEISEWRDPFIFREGGHAYMLTGGKDDEGGMVALHRAENDRLTQWSYVGNLFRYPGKANVECPNFVKFGNRWLLLVSLHGRVEWFSGHLKDLTFEADRHGILAEGSYASQLLTDEAGRCIHFAWVNTFNRKGWNGCLTLPSVLTLDENGAVIRQPIEAIDRLRDGEIAVAARPVEGTVDFTDAFPTDRVEVNLEIDLGTAQAVAMRMFGGQSLHFEGTTLTVTERAATDLGSSALRLRLYFDGSIMDLYANGGVATVSARMHPEFPPEFAITAEGGTAYLRSFTVHPMKPARMDMASGNAKRAWRSSDC